MNKTNDADIEMASLDRGKVELFTRYLLTNPIYCRDILGIQATPEAIEAYVEENKQLFTVDPKKKKEHKRRRL